MFLSHWGVVIYVAIGNKCKFNYKCSGDPSVWAVMCNKWSEVKVAQSCLTLCDPRDWVHGLLQARILECVSFSFSKGSPQPRYQTRSPSLQVDSLPADQFKSFSKIPPSQKRYPRKVFEKKNQLCGFHSCFYFKELVAHISHLLIYQVIFILYFAYVFRFHLLVFGLP